MLQFECLCHATAAGLLFVQKQMPSILSSVQQALWPRAAVCLAVFWSASTTNLGVGCVLFAKASVACIQVTRDRLLRDFHVTETIESSTDHHDNYGSGYPAGKISS